MKTYWKILCIASLAALAPLPCGADDNLLPALPPQVLAAMRGAGNKTATDINKTASVIEKFMLGIVTDVYPKTKDTWLENDCNSVSDPWLERSAAALGRS